MLERRAYDAEPSATVAEWTLRLVEAPVTAEHAEPYTELLARALVKLHIQKCVARAHLC